MTCTKLIDRSFNTVDNNGRYYAVGLFALVMSVNTAGKQA